MLKSLPTVLVMATIVCLGTFGWIEHVQRAGNETTLSRLFEKYPASPTTQRPRVGEGISAEPLDSSFGEQVHWMQVIVSLALTAAALFIILSARYAPKDKHWAYGIIGTIVGFWFRS